MTATLLNAANLHAGGGVAVATSVIAATATMNPDAGSLHVLASSEVDDNLAALSVDLSRCASYRKFDLHGISSAFRRVPVKWGDIDVVLNIFGPVYHFRLAWRSVCGVAQPNIAFPNNLYQQQLDPKTRVQMRLKYAIQTAMLVLPSCLFVEQEQVAQGLRSWRILRHKRIEVIPNTVDSVYGDPTRWQRVELPPRNAEIRMGLVSRNYPHKNLAVLPVVREQLENRLGKSVEILVTLTDEEWAAAPPNMRDALINVGPLALAQGPSFYRSLDCVIFPTLLECFSATPIEARAMGVPLFASNLPVIRETVGDYAKYFNPLDPTSIAEAIANDLPSPVQTIAANMPSSGPVPSARQAPTTTARDRAAAMLDLCRRTNSRVRAGVGKRTRTATTS